MPSSDLPKIEMVFDGCLEGPSHAFYKRNVQGILKQLLPDWFFDSKWQQERSGETLRKKIANFLPLVKTTPYESAPACISFFSLFRYRVNAFAFFFDLISLWLIPRKRLNVALVHAVDFKFPQLGDDLYTLCEVMIKVDSQNDLDLITRNFSHIEMEARLGVDSEYYARKILEIKGMSSDQKTSLIQTRIANLIKRMPGVFTKEIFNEMQHILVLCHEDFKKQRSISHLSRLISAHYLFRIQLLELIKEIPDRRHVKLKLFKTVVDFPQGKRQVLALMAGINFIRDKEVFEQRHLLHAIQHYIPNAEAIDQTFISNRKGSEQLTTIYIEIEKSDGKLFSREEIDHLKHHLPKDLQNHVGRLMLPVFMPRNEEEIMRNILSLSHQIKYLRDIPQVFITFDEQTDRNLFFTVIFVRILRGEEKSIQERIRLSDSFLRYIHDRTRVVGMLRKKYPKEASVFRLKFSKDNFLRGDHSIDLYKARQSVVTELSRILGEFRDFNGGMISKQNELLKEVRVHLSNEGVRYNEILLENFFYSLAPVIMRTVLEPHAFKTLFAMLVEEAHDKALLKGQKCKFSMKFEPDFSYVILTAPHRNVLDDVARGLNKFNQLGGDLVQGYAKTSGHVSMGYIYRCMDPLRQAQFRSVVEASMESYTQRT